MPSSPIFVNPPHLIYAPLGKISGNLLDKAYNSG
jgi:hypothetical protein